MPSADYAVTATPVSNGNRIAMVTAKTVTGFTIRTKDITKNGQDSEHMLQCLCHERTPTKRWNWSRLLGQLCTEHRRLERTAQSASIQHLSVGARKTAGIYKVNLVTPFDDLQWAFANEIATANYALGNNQRHLCLRTVGQNAQHCQHVHDCDQRLQPLATRSTVSQSRLSSTPPTRCWPLMTVVY